MQTIYNIINRFSVDDQTTRAMNRMAASTMGLNSAIYSTRSALGSLLTMGTVFAGAYALVGLKKGLYDYNDELEQAEVSLGAIFNAGMKFPTPDGGALAGMQKFNNAVGVAQDLMVKFQQDAALSVGTTMDFVNVAKLVSNPLMGMGKGIEDLRAFTNLTINTATVLGVDIPQAARDMMSSLTGVAGIDVKLFRLLGIEGGAKQFNALAPTERFDVLTTAMKKYEIAATAFAMTNKGLGSTVVDLFSIFLGKSGRSAFETWKSNLADMLTSVKENTSAIDTFQQKLGVGLSKGLQGSINSVKLLYANRDMLMTLAAAYAGGRMLTALSGMSLLGTGRRIARRGIVGGAQLIGMARSPANWMRAGVGLSLLRSNPLGVFQGLFNLFKGSAISSIMSFVRSFGFLVRNFTIAGIVITFFAGILNALRTNVNGCMTQLWNSLNRVIGVVMRLAGGVGSPLGRLFSWLMNIGTLIGGHVISALAWLIDAIATMAEVAVKAAAGIGGAYDAIKNSSTKDILTGKADVTGAFMKAYNGVTFDTGTDYMGRLTEGFKTWSANAFIPGETNVNEGGAATPKNNTTINGGVHIYQEFKENHEPDRIAFATVGLLNRLANNPVQPKRSLSLGGV